MSIYLDLTREFNAGKLRAVISSGQAVVLHRLAIMSKDGDWILREDEETLTHVLSVLDHCDARYRFGAPLDVRWMRGGWSAHFEFRREELRIRTDFGTRPPRLSSTALRKLWSAQEGRNLPFVDAAHLAEIKKTNREKDYAVIGELARLMNDPREQLLYSRSARDLIGLAAEHPVEAARLESERPVLAEIERGRDALEAALDAERRRMMRANEERLAAYGRAAARWRALWPEVRRELDGCSLADAHEIMVRKAAGVLPYRSEGAAGDG
jgi:hypothetical protein